SKQNSKEMTRTAVGRVWTYSEALRAVPYFRSLLRSLREHALDVQSARLQLWVMDDRPGRPDRKALIQREEVIREIARAQVRFEETAAELLALEVHSTDPVNGLALVPFAHGDRLAWFVVDLFAPEGLVGWRHEADAPEARWPLELLPAAVILR